MWCTPYPLCPLCNSLQSLFHRMFHGLPPYSFNVRRSGHLINNAWWEFPCSFRVSNLYALGSLPVILQRESEVMLRSRILKASFVLCEDWFHFGLKLESQRCPVVFFTRNVKSLAVKYQWEERLGELGKLSLTLWLQCVFFAALLQRHSMFQKCSSEIVIGISLLMQLHSKPTHVNRSRSQLRTSTSNIEISSERSSVWVTPGLQHPLWKFHRMNALWKTILRAYILNHSPSGILI